MGRSFTEEAGTLVTVLSLERDLHKTEYRWASMPPFNSKKSQRWPVTRERARMEYSQEVFMLWTTVPPGTGPSLMVL